MAKKKRKKKTMTDEDYKDALIKYILAGNPIFTETRKGNESEELQLDPEEREHPDTEFQSIYKKDDPIRSQFSDDSYYFLSKHGDRGHLVRVKPSGKVFWVKESWRTLNNEPKDKRPVYVMTHYIKNEKDKIIRESTFSIATYDLMRIVYGNPANIIGSAKVAMEEDIFKAFGTSKGTGAGTIRGHHIHKYDPEKPDDPDDIEFISQNLDDFRKPLQLDATYEEIIEDQEKYSERLEEEGLPQEGKILVHTQPIDKNGNIEVDKGRYFERDSGNHIMAIIHYLKDDQSTFEFDFENTYKNYISSNPGLKHSIEEFKKSKDRYTRIDFTEQNTEAVEVELLKF